MKRSTVRLKTKLFVSCNPLLILIALVLIPVTIIALACCGNLRRQYPANLIFLFIFTIAESFLLGTISSYYDIDVVAIAAGATVIICLGLTVFAFQSRIDFSVLSGILVALSLVILSFGITAIFYQNDKLWLLIAAFIVVVFSIYLVIGTQLIIGGAGKISLSPEEYIFAALNLYLDIINIFLYILLIVGRAAR
ncbi:protein lifeguard 1-like [Diabrotica virgifera virgifera]|uniref:Protein lifeguard 1-like n=1 Tax=Diabrotica virgifera virgifera TaxID=50390 RepID=A0ABM5KKI1_DIAVI|nr:protein lifeguard 1-like [Diabrotica virgifera virgifera]